MIWRTPRVIMLAVCSLMLTACGDAISDLPKNSTTAEPGGPTPRGHIAYQPPFLPISFSVDSNGHIAVHSELNIVTPLGTFRAGAEGRWIDNNDQPLPAEPADVTRLIICNQHAEQQACDAYLIGTGRKMRVTMNGHIEAEFEHDLIKLDASPGSTIEVVDIGPPVMTDASGPARIAIENLRLHETSPDTVIDLERLQGGNKTDLSYDHITGELRLLNGAKVASIKQHGLLSEPDYPEDIPGEKECQKATDWKDEISRDAISDDDEIVACIKTAEADLGYLLIIPDHKQKPVAFHLYSKIWVR
jgi:hypothetical protein